MPSYHDPYKEAAEEENLDDYRAWVRDIAAIARLHGETAFASTMAAGAIREAEMVRLHANGFEASLAYLLLQSKPS
jgi:hypothetical protein